MARKQLGATPSNDKDVATKKYVDDTATGLGGSDVLTTSNTKTVTNKTISGSSNTITNLGSSVSSTGPFASLPAAGNAGRIYACTDTGLVLRDNGSSWDYILANTSVGLGAPPTSGWSTTALGTATITADKGSRLLTIPTGAVNSWRGEHRAITSNYTATFYLEFPAGYTSAANYFGIYLYDGTKVWSWGPTYWSDNATYYIVTAWNGVASYNSHVPYGTTYDHMNGVCPNWWRIRDDGTNRHHELSWNGVDWFRQRAPEVRTTFLTPTHIGWGGYSVVANSLRLRSLTIV